MVAIVDHRLTAPRLTLDLVKLAARRAVARYGRDLSPAVDAVIHTPIFRQYFRAFEDVLRLPCRHGFPPKA